MGCKGEKSILFLVGPTGIGKSEIAIELAMEFKTEIISADSRQIYRGMDIGTAKLTRDKLSMVRHYLIDIVDPDEHFSAGIYRDMADECITRIHEKGMIPIIVGGTGLYIKAVAYGLWNGPTGNWNLRARLWNEERQYGNGYIYNKLCKVDPESAKRIHPNDKVKLIRALEVYYIKGRPLSCFHRDHNFKESLYNFIMIGLRRERRELYKRIEKRVDRMIEDGLIDEVKGLMDKGYNEELPSMQGLGYRQIIGYLKGRYDLDRAIALLKRDSKRYAKRQLIWFNKEKEIIWIDLDEDEGLYKDIQKAKAEIIQIIRQRLHRLTHGYNLF